MGLHRSDHMQEQNVEAACHASLYVLNLRGVGTGGATGARAPLVLQQATLTYKTYFGLSLRDPVGSADHMAQGVRDDLTAGPIGITVYTYN